MTVSVIYVAYRTPVQMLQESIESVRLAAAHAQIDLEVLIADNGGVALYKDHLGDAMIVGTGENLGFGHAVNHATSAARGEYVLLMNPDSVADPELFVELLEAQSVSASATMFGALLKKQGRPQVHAYNIWWSSLQLLLQRRAWTAALDRVVAQGVPTPVTRLCGAGLYARSSDLTALGPFDTDFFLYGEDVDLSLRAKAAGHALVLVPRAVISHDAGTSSEGSSVLVERARTDAHLRLLANHRNRLVSLLGRADAALSTIAGAILVRSTDARTTRLARLQELRRWGLKRTAAPFNPTAGPR